MPTYDYHCETCGRDFEAYRSFTDESLPKCPGREEGSCSSKGKGKVTKVLSVPAISFRGDGFYKNDSRASSTGKSKTTSESSSESSSSKDTSSEGSSSKADKSSDTKPATAAKKPDKKKASSSDAA